MKREGKSYVNNIKKSLSIMLICLIMLQTIAFPIDIKAESSEVILTTEATEIKAGDTITIVISAPTTAVGSIDALLIYDTTIFEQITEDDINCTAKNWFVQAMADDGYMVIANSKGTTDTGEIATITLTVLQDATQSDFTMQETYITLDDNSSVLVGDIVLSIPNSVSTYNISYKPNTLEQVTNMPQDATKTGSESYTIEAGPTRTGYTFIGWNTSSDGSGISYAPGSTYSAEADLDLYAQWQVESNTLTVNPNGGIWEGSSTSQTITQDYGTTKDINDPTSAPDGYTVKFNSNGGTSSTLQMTQTQSFSKWALTGGGSLSSGNVYTFGDTDGTLTANYTGDSIILPDATKTGATLKGWYTAITGGTRVGEAGDSFTPTENLTVFAQWEDINYTLTVNPNGGTWNGSASNGTIQGTYNSTETIADPKAPDGYTVTLDNDGTITNKVQTQTFTGWTVVTGTGTISGTTYTFGAEDGEISATYTSDSVDLGTPTKEGYTFDGWYTEASGGTQVSTTYKPTSDITLYAHWSANTYTITFDNNDGTGSTTSKDVTYGETYGNLPTPTKPGYEFDGWYDENNNKIESTDIVDITKNITLTAAWVGAEYTVTFDADGGTVDVPTKSVRNEGTYGELPTPTKEGYTFDGWYDENGNKIESTTTVNLTSDTTLTANWTIIQTTLTVDPNGGTWEGSSTAQTITQDYNTTKEIDDPTGTPDGYIVTFDGNGGTASKTQITQTTTFEKWTMSDGSDFVGTTYTYGVTDETLTANYTEDSITLPDATKAGATFKGWYTSATGGTKVGEAGDDYTPTSAITLFAQYEDIEYTLTVDPNGGTWNGSAEVQTEKGTYTTTITIVNPIAPDGYTVTLDNDGTTEDIVQTKEFEKWTLSDGSDFTGTTYTYGTADETITAVYTENSVELPTPTKEGYTFDGWYTSQVGGTQVSTPYMPKSDITLYAQWTANTYKITFDSNSGTVDVASKEVTYGEPYGTLPTPIRAGYDFDGWYDINDKKIVESDIVNITSDTTLTAKWIGKEYTVTFDANGGTVDIATKTVRNEEEYGDLPVAEKEGYTFIGWYDINDNKIESTTIADLTSDTTIYAKYQINEYTVTIQNDDGTILETIVVEHGSDAEPKTTTPVKNDTPAGYESTFNGWDSPEKLENVTEDRVIKATYTLTPIVYTIKYENLNGRDNSQNPTTYTVEDTNIQLIDLENQEKSIFKGWYTTNDNTGIKVTSIDTSKVENIILYAQWEEDKLYLKSQKYKVGENDIDIYEESDIYLDKIEPETTVAELINNCDTNGTITVINEEGEVLGEDDLVGTNMTIKATRNEEEIILTAVVMGDLDGNGKVTATDLSALNQTVLKIIEIKDAVFKAADLDDNEKITATDLSTINNTILKNITLTYDKNLTD